jgi:putative addiction module killer protein
MAGNIKPKTLIFYRNAAGNEPFSEWIDDFRDPMTRRRILQRVFRVESGNYGDYKSLKDGVSELRLDFGPGYRVYFGEDGDKIVILLCGGDKSTQTQDIERAKAHWKEYLSHG